MSTITINGEPREIDAGTTLDQLLAALGNAPEALATAVNGEFVAREQRAQCRLADGDDVFTFQPITGG